MPESTKLQAQTTAEDAALVEVGWQNSLFVQRPHSAVTDYAIQEKKYPFNGAVTTGTDLVAEIHKEGTLLRDLTLVLKAPALTPLVTGAPTYARYPDFGGLQFLNRDIPITFEYGSTNVHRVYPDQIYSDYFYQSNEDRVSSEQLMGGERTPAERNTLALAVQEFRIPIPTPWEGCGNELPISALASNLKIRFPLAPARATIQTDGVKPDTYNFTEAYLRYELIHVPGSDREDLSASTYSQEGRFTLFTDVFRKEVTIPANAMFNPANIFGYPVELRDVTGALRNLSGILRESTAMDANSANPSFYEINTDYLKNLTFSIRANDRVLFEETRPNYEQVEQVRRLYGCAPDVGQFHAFWDQLPKHTHAATGQIALANFSSASLHLRSSVAHPELRLTLICVRWNWTNQKNGNYQRIWN
jgi:hypothetical protein